MNIARTPDERFASLTDWPYAPIYTNVNINDGSADTLRIHHVDEGPHDARETILLMHGEPTWGYLYRHMMKSHIAAGHRVIVPDLVGFGRSDKPTSTSDYTYERHVDWMCQWFSANNFTNVTLVCQDWGGLIGLRIATAFPDQFARLVISNTGLPDGQRPMSDAFLVWQKFSQEVPVFEVGKLIQGGCNTKPLDPAVIAAYDAPFPDDSYKAGARIFPTLTPDSPSHPSGIANAAAWEVLQAFTKPVLTAFSNGDPVTRGGHSIFQREIPGAQGQPHTTIEGGGHFVQEDKGPEFAAIVNNFIAGTAQ
jgi:haloalkane dehalogenase